MDRHFPPWNPTNWWWWSDWSWWYDDRHQGPLPEEQAQVDPRSNGGYLTDWPAEDDPTNYTIYTEDIINANVAHYTSQHGGGSGYPFCAVFFSLAGLGLREFVAYLRRNPEFLAAIAAVMEVAPEAVLLMGLLLAAALIIVAGFCAVS